MVVAVVATTACLLMTMGTARSFCPTRHYSQHSFGSDHYRASAKRLRQWSSSPPPAEESLLLREQRSGSGDDDYGIGGQNLSRKWMELVRDGHVTATTALTDGDDSSGEGLRVRYGVRLELEEQEHEPSRRRLLEFVELLSSEEEGDEFPELRDRISSINATLAEMQQRPESDGDGGPAIRCVYEGPYAAQLQLVRTLRPPRSRDMSSSSSSEDEEEEDRQEAASPSASCRPPPYDASNDSFLVGSLRLFGHGEFHGEGQPRERAARLLVPRDESAASDGTGPFEAWDVFHNISPVDPRGHYLLLPAMDDRNKGWRDQSLLPSDCRDVTYLASTIHPPGSMALSFNSVGAGASQNHVHFHAWVSPPPPLLIRGGKKGAEVEDDGEDNDDGDELGVGFYAVTRASPSTSLPPLVLANGVTVAMLEYPTTCLRLSSPPLSPGNSEGGTANLTTSLVLAEMGEALSRIAAMAREMGVPHNVAWTNYGVRPSEGVDAADDRSDNLVAVDTYVFFRRAESSTIANGDVFRLGASEMLGVFHSSSAEQLESLPGRMENILSDVSWEPRRFVWTEACGALEDMVPPRG